MYPSFAPPVLSVNGAVENGGTFTLVAALTMTAGTGTIYYTTDGSDPRTSSSGFTVASIVLSGTTATVTLDDVDTGLYNGELIYISGASADRLRQQFHYRQRDREFHRRDHHLHLHGQRFARLARYA